MPSSGQWVSVRLQRSAGRLRAANVAFRGSTPAPATGIQAAAGSGWRLGALRVSLEHKTPPGTEDETVADRWPGSAARTTPTRPATRSLLRSPAFDVGPKPKLDPPLTEIDHRLRHVGVPALVLAHGVPMRQV